MDGSKSPETVTKFFMAFSAAAYSNNLTRESVLTYTIGAKVGAGVAGEPVCHPFSREPQVHLLRFLGQTASTCLLCNALSSVGQFGKRSEEVPQ